MLPVCSQSPHFKPSSPPPPRRPLPAALPAPLPHPVSSHPASPPLPLPSGRRVASDDVTTLGWRFRRRHVFVLSEAGKPIYSRHGSEEALAATMGVIMALVSFIQSHGNALRAIRCGTAGRGGGNRRLLWRTAPKWGTAHFCVLFCGNSPESGRLWCLVPQNGRFSVGCASKSALFNGLSPKSGTALWDEPQNWRFFGALSPKSGSFLWNEPQK